MRTRTIWYLMSYPAHCPYLITSLYSLLPYWDGDITIFAWPDSYDIIKQIGEALGGRIRVELHEPAYRGKNDQFIDKITVAQQLPGASLYLDADTTIHSRLTPLFDAAEEYGFCATQFNDWTTSSNLMRGRIETLRAYPAIDPDIISKTVWYRWPSVNGGVWASRNDSPVLPQWHRWTWEATRENPTFIADEKVLHLMQVLFCRQGKMIVKQDAGRWNCSPRHQSRELRDDEVAVRHYHGDSNVRKDKSPKGWTLWWPLYRQCLLTNFGNLRLWHRQAEQTNKYMRHLPEFKTEWWAVPQQSAVA